MKKLLVITGLAILTGCSSKRLVVKNFTSSNSMCLDALLVNMSSTGCKTFLNEAGEHFVRLECATDRRSATGDWIGHEFYIIPIASDYVVPGTIPMCTDRNLTVSFAERD